MSDNVVFKAGGAEFLDPENVGSSVRWNVSVEAIAPADSTKKGYSHLSGEVAITDCSRAITWYLGSDAEGKLERAIGQLQNALAGLRRAKRRLAVVRKNLGISD